jgi:multidrug efflux system membrane fusion protein
MVLNRKIVGTLLIVTSLSCLVFVRNIIADDNKSIDLTVQEQPVMPVNVSVVEKHVTQVWKNFSARLEAVNYVEIQPQVSGTIMKVNFEDGQNVNEGDVIFVIDPLPYQAEVARSKAVLETAKADNEFAEQEYIRAQTLIKTNAISKRILDQRKSSAEMAKAAILSAQADLERVKIDLDRAYVIAPISGRLGRIEVTKGNLVESGSNAPTLTTIVSQESIYADFEVDEQTYLQFVRSNAKDKEEENNIPVRLKLKQDERVYEGNIYTFDNRINVTSGTIRARALFENKDRALLPGMFAQVEMGSSIEQNRMFIDERAIGTDQDRRFVFIVDKDNTVAYREIKLGSVSKGKREVLSGLDEGDKVIVDGIMFMHVGMKVKPVFNNESLSSDQTDQEKLSS